MIINSFRIQKDEDDKPYAYVSATFEEGEYESDNMKSFYVYSDKYLDVLNIVSDSSKDNKHSESDDVVDIIATGNNYIFRFHDEAMDYTKGIVYLAIVQEVDNVRQPSVLGTFYTKPLMDELISCLNDVEISDGGDGACNTGSKFTSKYLKYRSIALAMSAKDYSYAEKLYEKFYSDVKPSGKGCRCHG